MHRGYSKKHVVPAPPEHEKLRKAAGRTRLMTITKVKVNREMAGDDMRHVLLDAMVSSVVAMVECVYLHTSLSALEMQERWTVELLEEEQRAVVANMTHSMTQRCRFDGFISELYPRGPCRLFQDHPLAPKNPQTLVRLTYCSAAQHGFTEESLKHISEHATVHNTPKQITGHILYIPPFLFQVLEGPFEQVTKLFSKIWSDTRHHTISTVSFRRVRHRVFEEHEMRNTVIHPFQGLKGSVVVSIFQNLGHRYLTSMMYSSRSPDKPPGHEREVVAIAVSFSFQPESLNLVLDPIVDLVTRFRGEVLVHGVDNLVAVSEDLSSNFIELGNAIVETAGTLLSNIRYGVARGVVTRVPTGSRITVGDCLDRAMDLAKRAKANGCIAYADETALYLVPDMKGVHVQDGAVCVAKRSATISVTTPLHIITYPELPVIPPDALVRLTYVSCPRTLDIAASMHSLIYSRATSHIADKMILMKSADCKIVLHILEGHLSELLDLFALVRAQRMHKYCFQTSIAPIKEIIFSPEFEPLQVVTGDSWCPILKLLIKVISKTDHTCPEVLKKLAAANQAPSAVGLIPMARQIFATLVPVCGSTEGLCECYKILAIRGNETWVEVVEVSQRLVLACREGYILRLIHLCVALAGKIKSIPRAWCAIGMAVGRGISGHIGKANPLFFVSGEALEKSASMAHCVISKPNAHGSCMLLCPTSAALARMVCPDDPVVGIGSMGLHPLPTWNVYCVDHPNTDTTSRSISSTYYLVPRPLKKQLPTVMEDDGYVSRAPWMLPRKKSRGR